jgi:hypothetical protein
VKLKKKNLWMVNLRIFAPLSRSTVLDRHKNLFHSLSPSFEKLLFLYFFFIFALAFLGAFLLESPECALFGARSICAIILSVRAFFFFAVRNFEFI